MTDDNTLRFDNMPHKVLIAFGTVALLAAICSGCNDRPPPLSIATNAPPSAPSTAGTGAIPSQQSASENSVKNDPVAITAKGHPKQWWEAVYAYGTKIGWGHFEITNFEESGRKLVQIDNQNHIAVDREGQRTTIDISTQGVETPAGELHRFHTEMTSGASRTTMDGQIADGQLTIRTITPGKTTTESFPWTPGTLGFSATEQSLAAAPLGPADRRTLRALMPATNEVVTIELVADKFEPTSLLDHTEDLLRINCAITLPMQAQSDKPPIIRSQLWTNREGEVLKTSVAALHQDTFRTRRELALADSGPRRLDLVVDNNVPVARALVEPHQTHRIRYRVQLVNDDPAKVFSSGPLQELVSLDPHTAEIVVHHDGAAVNTGNTMPSDSASVHLPSPEDRAANNLIQCDDPQVVAMANSVLPAETDQRTLAVALEKLVHEAVKLKNFSQAFATAAEVARNPEGDCTEHAVLLAALARARGIPARVAIGLVYQPATQSFAYHMWNELWVGDHWLPLDATLGRGEIGAAHLKLSDSNLAGAQAYSCFLPVAQVIGQIKIEILDVE
jgi:Transglutaminase-like superfamily